MLGGAYAVALLVTARAEAALGRPIGLEELQSRQVRSTAAGLTVICASAGSHGLAVAAGARAFGAQAIVCLSEAVPDHFAGRLREGGATVMRKGNTYDQSIAYASTQAERHGWELVSDSSWPGYTRVPLAVMRGYTFLLEEATDALDKADGPATHVFVQAGVGGLAAAAAGYLRDRWSEGFKLVVYVCGPTDFLANARELL